MNNYKHELDILDERGFTSYYQKFLEYVACICQNGEHDVKHWSDAIDPELKKYDAYRQANAICFKTSEGYLEFMMLIG